MMLVFSSEWVGLIMFFGENPFLGQYYESGVSLLVLLLAINQPQPVFRCQYNIFQVQRSKIDAFIV